MGSRPPRAWRDPQLLSLEDAARELRWVLWDEPDWEGAVWLEPFHVVMTE